MSLTVLISQFLALTLTRHCVFLALLNPFMLTLADLPIADALSAPHPDSDQTFLCSSHAILLSLSPSLVIVSSLHTLVI